MKYQFEWHILLSEPYLQLFFAGIKITLILAFISTITSSILGTVVAILRVSSIRLLNIIGSVYVAIFRNIPVLFWILFFYYIFPEMLPLGIGNKLSSISSYSLIAGIMGLTVNSASYVSDILRSGRLSLPEVQRDVAISTGLSRVQQYVHVLLPQIFRLTLAPLGTRMVHNFKNTSLCIAIAAPYLMMEMNRMDFTTFRAVEAILLAATLYFLFSIAMASTIIILERYLKIDARNIIQSHT